MLTLNYTIKKDRRLDHMVVATIPGDIGYTIFKYGNRAACQHYIDTLTPEKEAREIAKINVINEVG